MITFGDKQNIVSVMLNFYVLKREADKYRSICKTYNPKTLSSIRQKTRYTVNVLSPFFRDEKLLIEISQKLIEKMV